MADEPRDPTRNARVEPREGSDLTDGTAPAAREHLDEVEEASVESFPASDPPSWTHLSAGPPDRHEQAAPSKPRGAEPIAASSRGAEPPPEGAGRPYTVIYDGNCRPCVRFARVLRRWDRLGQVWVIPSSDPRIPDLFPWIPLSAYERALQMVGPGRTTLEGAAAIEKLLDILPGGTPLARLFAIPVLGRLLDRGYRWFARSRGGFGCGDHCTIPLERPGARRQK